MKHFKSHLLLNISPHITCDPVLIMCMQRVFDWANEMGLKGQRVGSLTLVSPNEKEYDPMDNRITLWCKIECTEEEEKEFKELRMNQLLHNIATQLSE